MQLHAPIQPCLWFDTQAEEAAKHYIGIFPDARITSMSHHGDAGREVHGMQSGTVMTVAFELDGQPSLALNGGPQLRFTEAVSFRVMCDTREQIDHFWERPGEGGDAAARQCGWLKDRYGLSWQVVPTGITSLITGPRSDAVMAALMRMKKRDTETLRAAQRAAAQ